MYFRVWNLVFTIHYYYLCPGSALPGLEEQCFQLVLLDAILVNSPVREGSFGQFMGSVLTQHAEEFG